MIADVGFQRRLAARDRLWGACRMTVKVHVAGSNITCSIWRLVLRSRQIKAVVALGVQVQEKHGAPGNAMGTSDDNSGEI